MKRSILYIILTLVIVSSCSTDKHEVLNRIDENGYHYIEVTNDPTETRLYTLKNGLKVYLSPNNDEPKIKTYISVKAGSMVDPADDTGLAHYFEHLMFKGTDDFGTTNWDKEKPYIDSIATLYEKHVLAKTEQEKKEIYKEIDRLSQVASQYAIPNEYDKLTSAIGATNTNAFTNHETTTFTNLIPANELQRWLELEYERFSDPVLRLFHTEMEAVYEEYNMRQDNDKMLVNNALFEGLFKGYAMSRPIIGKPEHLKNPSMNRILEFHRTWYVPNNMAIILSGDLNYESAIKEVDATFGQMPSKPLPKVDFGRADTITTTIKKEVIGPSAEQVLFAYRFKGRKADDIKYVYLIDMLLNNTFAGLIDLNLVQQQKVMEAGCRPHFYRDYGVHLFYGIPQNNQTLDEVRSLILNEIEKIKKGEFEDWLVQAVINNMEVIFAKLYESNDRSEVLLNLYLNDITIADQLNLIKDLRKIDKEDIIEFARMHYNDNYVLVNKKQGPFTNQIKVERPEITPVTINRDKQSDYFTKFTSRKITEAKPVFVDYKKSLDYKEVKEGFDLYYVKNELNNQFELNFIWEMGSYANKELPIALEYLSYIGTNHFSPGEIQEEFYKIGITLKTRVDDYKTVITISGMNEYMLSGLELLEHLMADARVDSLTYDRMVTRIIKNREDLKHDPKAIRDKIFNYALYGEKTPAANFVSCEKLKNMDPARLTKIISDLNNFKHLVFYYGNDYLPEISNILKRHHRIENELKDCPQNKVFEPIKNKDKKVLLIHNDQKSQAEIYLIAPDEKFNMQTFVDAKIYNAYYGSDMSSVVFQEIRESQGLAYIAMAGLASPYSKDQYFFNYAMLFTQPDKMGDAIAEMEDLLDNMVKSENTFELAKNNIIKDIETDRITKTEIFWTWHENQLLGIEKDIREDFYLRAHEININDIQLFFDKHIANKNHTYIIVADKNNINMNQLKDIGPVEELSMETLFGY